MNLAKEMFVNCEKWRKDTNLDETVPTWEYPEKPEVAKYYKQFYHKTDKVCPGRTPTPICLASHLLTFWA